MGQDNTPVPRVRDYLVQSILATVLFCLPTDIVAIIYSKQVITKAAAGDIAGARESSEKAKKWINISVLVSLTIFIVFLGISMVSEQP